MIWSFPALLPKWVFKPELRFHTDLFICSRLLCKPSVARQEA
jgi:hypothetical protein